MQTAQFLIIAISFSSHKALYYPRDTYLHVTRGDSTKKPTSKHSLIYRVDYMRTKYIPNAARHRFKWSQIVMHCCELWGFAPYCPAGVPVHPHTPPPNHSNHRSARSTPMLLRLRSPRLHRSYRARGILMESLWLLSLMKPASTTSTTSRGCRWVRHCLPCA